MTTHLKPSIPPEEPGKRKTLEHCFRNAQERLRNEVISKSKRNEGPQAKESTAQKELEEFLTGTTNITDLIATFERTPEREKKDGRFEQLMTTLVRVQSLGDELISAAPESVSLVWFGLSSLISIGTMKVTVRQCIYSTCSSIVAMVELCFQLEKREHGYSQSSQPVQNTNSPSIWDSNIPELIFLILDFLWHAKPHRATKGLKSFGKTLKEAFTGALEEKSAALIEYYQKVVEKTQRLYEDFIICENIDIGKGLKEICTVAKDLVDIVRHEFLASELNRQKHRLEASRAHETHFRALQSRLDDITRHHQILGWLLTDHTYLDWKSRSTDAGLLCLEAPRGHGKSTAMGHICRDLQTDGKNIILRFFFKKGDNDIQRSHTALETVLFQLLDDERIRSSDEILADVVEILNPSYGSENEIIKAISFENPGALSEAISKITSVIPNRVYLILDALDECQDRKEKAILDCFKQLLGDNLRVIVSARDTINITAELDSADYKMMYTPDQVETTTSPAVRIIGITKERNAEDVKKYLEFEVDQVMGPLINKDRNENYFLSRVKSIVDTIFSKANGDFTRARLIVTHLKQPSKLPLDKKIEKLPDSIGDIYMSSLEALTPNQQELVVTALKWIVWGVSGVHVTEISDQYREIYHQDRVIDETPLEIVAPNGNSEANPIEMVEGDLLPFREEDLGPEVKEVLNHLRDGGRDFFRYDSNTGLVTVDISILEWIRNDTTSQSGAYRASMMNGFHRYRDMNGYTVFQLTLTPSFVKYGDILSPLFNEREAQMNLTLNILRTLNNREFKEKYMPWRQRWGSKETFRPRYEIEHWHGHLAILQKWWTEDSITDVWWSGLLQELDIFMRPENWHRWNIQRRPDVEPRWPNTHFALPLTCWYQPTRPTSVTFSESAMTAELFLRYYEKPIHFASHNGLHLILEYLLTPNSSRPRFVAPDSEQKRETSQYFSAKYKTICMFYEAWEQTLKYFEHRGSSVLPQLPFAEGYELLSIISQKTRSSRLTKWESFLVEDVLFQWDTICRASWFTLQAAKDDQFMDFASLLTDADKEAMAELRKNNGDDDGKLEAECSKILSEKKKEVTTTCPPYNVPDGLYRVPLHIGVLDAKVRKYLINCGANINTIVDKEYSATLLLQLLHALCFAEDKQIHRDSYLQGVRGLVTEGADLERRGSYKGASALHYAAAIHDLSLFRQIAQLKTWDILDVDHNERTPMHYLFMFRPPDSKIEEVSEIFKTLIRLGPDPSKVVNAQDAYSDGPLSLATKNGFIEGIRWLADLKVDIDDEDIRGQNCLHQLFNIHDEKRVNSIIRLLVQDLRADWRKRDKEGRTPLYIAIEWQNTTVALAFLDLYDKLGPNISCEDDFLCDKNDTAYNILHYLAVLPDSSRILDRILRLAGDKIDVYHRPDGVGSRPLELAMMQDINVDFAQRILESGSYVCGAGPSGLDEIDICCQEIIKCNTDDAEGGESIRRLKSILQLLFRHCPRDAIDALVYPIFHHKNPFLNEDEQEAMISQLDVLLTDTHGWSAAELLHVMGNDRFKDLPIEYYEGEFTKQKVPSKLAPQTDFSKFRTEDGLEFIIDPNMATYKLPSPYIYLSDHPITLSKKTTYFEVIFTFSAGYYRGMGKNERDVKEGRAGDEITASNVTKKTGEGQYFSVGLRSKVSQLLPGEDGYKLGIGCSSNGAIRSIVTHPMGIKCISQVWNTGSEDGCRTSRKTAFGISPTEHDGKHVIGCGMNSLEGKIFFTVNGEMLPLWFSTSKSPQFPIITMHNCDRLLDGFLVNFGKTEFAFEDANIPDWVWDGEVPKTDGMHLTNCPDQDGDI
ncbi:hypothetical protein TWF788_007355 [Orbilia oligospora]|uniref:B30.2/SPRY domain-containing protein n=1 Tax=Orbilia oligospora TaxID=2813651 RepID=A0A7C8U4N7_ORBOL|nr:hypothetical protein TWF788_007355 [Orbilia oligospora]